MLCKAKKNFSFSRTGLDSVPAKVGEEHDIPDALVPGLVKEGYVDEVKPEAKAVKAAPENKAVEAAPEDKGDETPKGPTKAPHGMGGSKGRK